MSNKQQGAGEKDQLIGQFIAYVRGWGANEKKIRIEYATKCAEIALEFHTQKRKEELKGIVEDMERKLDAMSHDETTTLDWMCGFQEAQDMINRLKNKEL